MKLSPGIMCIPYEIDLSCITGYKISIMKVDYKNIQETVRQIAIKFDPIKVVLFGSYAYGNPREDSDVDLLVIMDFDTSPTRQAINILKELDYHFGLDLITRTPSSINKRLEMGDFFLKEITEKGKVLYERTH